MLSFLCVGWCRVAQITDQNDLYVKAWLEGQDAQETDTHWRSKRGKVSLCRCGLGLIACGCWWVALFDVCYSG